MISLSAAIDALYATFATMPKPNAICACPCCLDSAAACKLLSHPLRMLSANDLSGYASCVFLTVGENADYRYLLPRIMEIGATQPGWWPYPEVLLGKLKLADWMSWSADERASVELMIHAWFQELLQVPPSKDRAGPYWYEGDGLLCGIAAAALDLEPYLQQLLDPDYARHLQALYWMNFDGTSGRVRLRNSFWRGRRDDGIWSEDAPAGAQLVGFLERPDIQAQALRWSPD